MIKFTGLCALVAGAFFYSTPVIAQEAKVSSTLTAPEAIVGAYRGVLAVDVSPDGVLFAVYADNAVVVYQTTGVVERFRLNDCKLVNSGSFSPDGQRLLVVRGSSPEVVDTAKGERHCLLDLPKFRPSKTGKGSFPASMVTRCNFSPDGKLIGLASGTLYHMYLDIFDAQSGKLVRNLLTDIDGVASQVTFSSDNTMIGLIQHPSVYALDVKTGELITRWQEDASYIRFAFGNCIALTRGVLHVVTVRPGGFGTSPPNTIAPEEALAKSLIVSVGDLWQFAILQKDSVLIRDRDGKDVAKIEAAGFDRVTCASFSANGKVAVIGRSNGRADVWRLKATYRARRRLRDQLVGDECDLLAIG